MFLQSVLRLYKYCRRRCWAIPSDITYAMLRVTQAPLLRHFEYLGV